MKKPHEHNRYVSQDYKTKFTVSCRTCSWEMVYEDELFNNKKSIEEIINEINHQNNKKC